MVVFQNGGTQPKALNLAEPPYQEAAFSVVCRQIDSALVGTPRLGQSSATLEQVGSGGM
jgi:hypothetical protein